MCFYQSIAKTARSPVVWVKPDNPLAAFAAAKSRSRPAKGLPVPFKATSAPFGRRLVATNFFRAKAVKIQEEIWIAPQMCGSKAAQLSCAAPKESETDGLQRRGPVRSLRPQAPSAPGGFGFYLIRATEYRFRIE